MLRRLRTILPGGKASARWRDAERSYARFYSDAAKDPRVYDFFQHRAILPMPFQPGKIVLIFEALTTSRNSDWPIR